MNAGSRTLFCCLAVLLLMAAVVPAASADHLDMDRDTLAAAIIPYMKATHLGEDVVHLAPVEMQTAACRYLGMPEPPEDDSVLRIATPNKVKECKFFDDYYIGIFSHLSNMPLTRVDVDGEVIGLTADHFEISPDNTEWTFSLRDDLFWSDGKRVTPEDVKFTFEYLDAHTENAPGRDLAAITTSEAENSVTFVFNQPNTKADMDFAVVNILPEHVWKDIDDPANLQSPGPFVGCGPFYLEAIDTGAMTLRYAKNQHWKQARQPHFGHVEVQWFGNEGVAVQALKNGKVDAYYRYGSSLSFSSVATFEDDENFDVRVDPTCGLVFLSWNTKRAPLDDIQFREAIVKAIDYQQLVDTRTLGYGQIPTRGLIPDVPGMYYKDTPRLACDPAGARQILIESGYKDVDSDGYVEDREGNELTLDFLVRSSFDDEATMVQKHLKDVGIRVPLNSVENSVWFGLKDEFDYDLIVTSGTPWGMLGGAGFGTSYFDTRRIGMGTLHNVDDPAFLDLNDRILATSNKDELRQFAGEVQDYYADELPAVALYWKKVVTPLNKQFTGWSYDPIFGIYNIDTFLNVRAA